MERQTPFEVGEFYHIYNRGIDRRKIFFSTGDRIHFQRLLYICNDSTNYRYRLDRIKKLSLHEIKKLRNKNEYVDIVAYVMMDNHFHLLLKEKRENGITEFMRKFMTSYVMYMNRKYNRTGALMCRPFRAKHVDSDEYFRWLISYIHMNPIDQVEPRWKKDGVSDKRKALEFLQKYRYSSYRDYFILNRDESLILNKEALPIDIKDLENLSEMFEVVSEYEEFTRLS